MYRPLGRTTMEQLPTERPETIRERHHVTDPVGLEQSVDGLGQGSHRSPQRVPRTAQLLNRPGQALGVEDGDVLLRLKESSQHWFTELQIVAHRVLRLESSSGGFCDAVLRTNWSGGPESGPRRSGRPYPTFLLPCSLTLVGPSSGSRSPLNVH